MRASGEWLRGSSSITLSAEMKPWEFWIPNGLKTSFALTLSSCSIVRGSSKGYFFTMSVSFPPFFGWYSFLPPSAARFSDSIMAIACLRLVTFFPDFDPLCRFPFLNFPMTSS